MIDMTNVDVEEFRDKFEQLESIMETNETIKASIKEVKEELAAILGINKRKIGAVVKMLINMKQEGEPIDESLADGVKELYIKAREVN